MKNYSETDKTMFTIFILVFLAVNAFAVACVAVAVTGGELSPTVISVFEDVLMVVACWAGWCVGWCAADFLPRNKQK